MKIFERTIIVELLYNQGLFKTKARSNLKKKIKVLFLRIYDQKRNFQCGHWTRNNNE